MHLCCRLFEDPPSIQEDVLNILITKFEISVDKCLRMGSSAKNIKNVDFRNDAFNFLFEQKMLLQEQNFSNCYFSLGWDQVIKQHDQQGNKLGVKVLFPVEVKRKYLKWMTREHYKQRLFKKPKDLKKRYSSRF